MPKKLLDILSETEQKVETLRELGSNKRQLREEEVAVIATCTKRAEALLTFPEQFRIRSPPTQGLGANAIWGSRRLSEFRKVRLAPKVKLEENTLLDFQASLDSVLRLAEIQMQCRTE